MKLRKPMSGFWKPLRQRSAGRPTPLTPAELTRLSWARLIESPAALPEIYRPYLDQHLDGTTAFPACIITPTFHGFLHQENEKLIFLCSDSVHVLERSRDGLTATVFRIDSIDRIEFGAVLLKAWLTLSGIDQQGASKTVSLRFNAVNDRLFYPLIEKMRLCHTRDRSAPESCNIDAERAIFDDLESRSFKFMNYARRSLLSSEHVLGYVHQHELRRPALSLFGKPLITIPLTPAHLCILTDSELILIRDDPESMKGCDDGRYGGVWTFLPRAHLTSTELITNRYGVPCLLLTMRSGVRLECLFSGEPRRELAAFIETINTELAASTS